MTKNSVQRLLLYGVSTAVCIGAFFVLAFLSLGSIIRHALTSYATTMLGTSVKIGACAVSLFTGEIRLCDIAIENPEGFSTQEAIRIATLTVRYNPLSLLRDTTVITSLTIQKPDIRYERNSETDNIRALLGAIEQRRRKHAPARQEKGLLANQGSRDKKKFLLRELVVASGNMTLSIPMVSGKTLSFPLPPLRLNNLGSDTGGATAAAIATLVFKSLYASLSRSVIDTAVGTLFGPLQKQDGLKGER
ncbi:MAG: AsmA family protein [Desulfobacterota bacterium]|nr:AsmA family protein [Thermodesulfobacteriota bacterium]